MYHFCVGVTATTKKKKKLLLKVHSDHSPQSPPPTWYTPTYTRTRTRTHTDTDTPTHTITERRQKTSHRAYHTLLNQNALHVFSFSQINTTKHNQFLLSEKLVEPLFVLQRCNRYFVNSIFRWFGGWSFVNWNRWRSQTTSISGGERQKSIFLTRNRASFTAIQKRKWSIKKVCWGITVFLLFK